MAQSRQIENKMKEFEHNLWNLTEAFIDGEEELLDKISELETEIKEHNCENP